LKIWLKVTIIGAVIFLIGILIGSVGNTAGAISITMILSTIGGILFVIGLIVGITRGFGRMMNE